MVTPMELARAIYHGEGMRVCIGDMYYINTNCKKYRKRGKSFHSGGGLSDLGRINELKYMTEEGESIKEKLVCMHVAALCVGYSVKVNQ